MTSETRYQSLNGDYQPSGRDFLSSPYQVSPRFPAVLASTPHLSLGDQYRRELRTEQKKALPQVLQLFSRQPFIRLFTQGY